MGDQRFCIERVVLGRCCLQANSGEVVFVRQRVLNQAKVLQTEQRNLSLHLRRRQPERMNVHRPKINRERVGCIVKRAITTHVEKQMVTLVSAEAAAEISRLRHVWSL